MRLIDKIKIKAKQNKKTIVLPESSDGRVIEAASIILRDDIANIIIIGNKNEINSKFPKYDISKAIVIDPLTSSLTEELANELYNLRKDKGLDLDNAKKLIKENYMYFSCMLLKTNRADGIVSGACHTTADTLRPALQIIKCDKHSEFVSSFFLMEVEDTTLGCNGAFIFADCAIMQEPNSSQLADIAGASAKSFISLVNSEPIVAMLSYSTAGSGDGVEVLKVIEATKTAKQKFPQYKIDGEMQLDAAIVKEVASLKYPDSDIAGHANTLIFPNLSAGNIGYKLVQKLSNCSAYGPITQGMNKPVNDLSRGCSADDIVSVIAITAVQAN